MIPRWLRRFFPLRRRVLPRPLSGVANPIVTARFTPKRTQFLVPINWSRVTETVLEHFIPVCEDDLTRKSAVYQLLQIRELRPRLLLQLRGWQRISPHLSAEDSWLAWRAIVGDYRRRCA